MDLKEKTHKHYRTFGSLWCPGVKDNVIFNMHGWVHLSFDSRGHRRSNKNIALRLHLFTHVAEVVKNANVLTKPPEQREIFIRGKKRSVTYYEIAHGCDGGKQHLTVILRRIEDGKLHYYSVRRTSNKTKKALANAGLS